MSTLYGNVANEYNAPSGIFRSTSRLVVESLLLRQTGTFNEQFIRPFVTNPQLTDRDLTNIATSIATVTKNGAITPFSVSGEGGAFLTRSSAPEAKAEITNGWDTQRMRFLMKIKLISPLGDSNTMIISGYTDYFGMANGHLDPRMVFYVNSITKLRNVNYRTQFGSTNIVQPVGMQQVITNHASNNGFNPSGNNDLRMFSPGDVFTAIGSAPFYRSENFEAGSDKRYLVDGRGKASPKSITNANAFIASTLNSFIAGPEENYQTPKLEAAYSYYMRNNSFETNELWRNEFFAALDHNKSGYGMKTSSFTIGDLQKIDPNVNSVTTFVNSNPGELHEVGLTSYWNGSDLNTVAASIIASSVPSLMSEQLISRIAFTSTNSTIGGQPFTNIVHGEGISNSMDMVSNYERFKTAFDFLVIKDITFNNQMAYQLLVECDIVGHIKIKIKMDNYPEQDFVYPTFCDSIISPVLTTNLGTILKVSEDFNSLMTYVSDAKTEVAGLPDLSIGVKF